MTDNFAQLKDGLFQVAMALYKEYAKYTDQADARARVYNDLVALASDFVTRDTDGMSSIDAVVNILKAEVQNMEEEYNSISDASARYRIIEDITTLEKTMNLLESRRNRS